MFTNISVHNEDIVMCKSSEACMCILDSISDVHKHKDVHNEDIIMCTCVKALKLACVLDSIIISDVYKRKGVRNIIGMCKVTALKFMYR